MCRSTTEPGGPRRCAGDTRASYSRAASRVATLERAEAELLCELSDIPGFVDTIESPSRRQVAHREVVRFSNKDTRLERIRAEIDTAVAELDTGEQWQDWLDYASKFHSYSLNNQLLVWMQCPDATRVAGMKKWNSMGRRVMAGQSAIWIQAPITKKFINPAGEEEVRLVGFRPVVVWDAGQTTGERLPEPPIVEYTHLTGTAPPRMHTDLEAIMAGHGYTVVRRDLGDGPGIPNGYTEPESRLVVINSCYSDAHQAKTLAHELAHVELAHTTRTAEYHTRAGGQRPTMEVEAESVSYIIGRHYGLSPGPASFPYIDGWASGNREQIRSTAERVVAASSRILNRIGASAATTL
jgi:hypothetical protein